MWTFSRASAFARTRLATAAFLVVAATIGSAELALTRALGQGSMPDLVAAGILVDLLEVSTVLVGVDDPSGFIRACSRSRARCRPGPPPRGE